MADAMNPDPSHPVALYLYAKENPPSSIMVFFIPNVEMIDVIRKTPGVEAVAVRRHDVAKDLGIPDDVKDEFEFLTNDDTPTLTTVVVRLSKHLDMLDNIQGRIIDRLEDYVNEHMSDINSRHRRANCDFQQREVKRMRQNAIS